MKFNLTIGCLRCLAILLLGGVLPAIQNEYTVLGVLMVSMVLLSIDATA